ncbi:GDP-mannose-dependent alpha-mannosyltransferase [Aureimonas endophytica]|uniref:GDP-mannose-dependent alpha-mannosyltransferase n=1 Tax=Aureimonas endophytica TaxID=2027858 RepID=A0A916ZH99_9HYPH|nr:glycosyltransferase family 1 protein [Aureimonas endophytica]GGD97818.1 GDP-mannose-dependent alpha-mannosyltransferase [Aureimonas endophytica]
MRLLLATDAWEPQVNGVVRTLTSLCQELAERGVEVRIVAPKDFRTIPCPTYPEIRLALATAFRVGRVVDEFRPDAIHIATEGPVGIAARKAAMQRGLAFTTSFHTRFPEYLRKRAPVPDAFSYALLRRFHAPASACLVPTDSIRQELETRGFRNLAVWTRGVDRALFKPLPPLDHGLPGPVFLTVSRVAPEKNLEAFLDLDLPGSKIVVGAGPSLGALIERYPKVHFAGLQTGEALARYYSSADVFVFPSRTDTFGIVLIEALACGVPVAAFPVPGPLDVIADTKAGCLSEDLRAACLGALALRREDALERSRAFSWELCADIFLDAATRSARKDTGLRLAG